MRLSGFIKIHRKLIEWGWYQNYIVKDLFIHLLLIASFKDTQWMGIEIKKGQIITSHERLAQDLGFSVQQVRTAINKLKSTGEITSKSTNKFTLITIEKWEDYQLQEEISTSKLTGKSTNEQQASNKQITNNQQHRKNVKKLKNEKKKEYAPDRHPSPSGEVASMGGSLGIELECTIGNPIPKGMSVEEYERRKAEARL